jgi:hypothetical protein
MNPIRNPQSRRFVRSRALLLTKTVLASTLVIVGVGAAGCGGTGTGESTGSTSQADANTDLMSEIADEAAVTVNLFGADPWVAGVVGLLAVGKDVVALSLDGNSDPSAALQAEINQANAEIQQLQTQIETIQALEQQDAIALDLDVANTTQGNLATVAQELTANLQAVEAGTASSGTMAVLQQDVFWVENMITSSIEPAIEDPVPGAYPAGSTYWFQTYEMAISVRLALAVAGFPLDYSWVLARYENMHSSAYIPWANNQNLWPWEYPGSDGSWQTTVNTWGAVLWGMLEPYRAIRGAADFDGDGIPDLVMHDPSTGAVIATRMVPHSTYIPPRIGLGFSTPGETIKSFSAGWTAGGWVYTLATVDATVWHLSNVADFNGDGKPDLLFETVQPIDGMSVNGFGQGIGSGEIMYTNGSAVTQTAVYPGWPQATAHCIGKFGVAGQQAEMRWNFVRSVMDANNNELPPAWGSSVLDVDMMTVPLPPPEGGFSGGPELVTSANPLTGVDLQGRPYLDGTWRQRGCADFNGDGLVDPLWYHGGSPDGVVQAWLTSSWGGAYEHVAPTAVGVTGQPGQDIRAVGDFDGDGHPDLFWQDDNAGTLFVTGLEGVAGNGDVRYVTIGPKPNLPPPPPPVHL